MTASETGSMKQPCYVGDHAVETPDKAAVIHGLTGEVLSYRELDERSNRLAQYLHSLGLGRGDRLALFMENHIRYLEICWAALRSGLLVVPISRFLTAVEADYIVNDSDAKVVISSFALRETAAELLARSAENASPRLSFLMVGGTIDGWSSYEDTILRHPAQRLDEEWLGATMLYSSGTTGRPKGIIRAQPDRLVSEGPTPVRRETIAAYGITSETVYLSPAPLYHAAPLGFCLDVQFCGGTVVIMDKFDPLEALRMIERYRISHSQWVPTMFVRMLKLSDEERYRYDLSSHRVAVHAAAPCPVEVKRRMIDWWGPILVEYYAASEANGATFIDSKDWLAHPGSVGRARLGVLHVCDEAGDELPAGQGGLVYFERDALTFHYHKDPQKTRSAQHPLHPTWTTLGDIGYVDEEGYLYLTDRQSFMIISGGVNIYPQAIENALVLHPAVTDVAVIGVPNADLGEEVKAIVQPAPWVTPSEALADELIHFLRGRIGRHMLPRSVDFVEELPRLPTGKLRKHELRARYLSS